MKQPEALENLNHAGNMRAMFDDRGMILVGIAFDTTHDVVAEEVWTLVSDYDWCDDLGGVDMPPPLNALSYAWEVHDLAKEKLR